MSKWSISLLCLAGAIALAPSLHAQAIPTASSRGGDLQVGVGAMFLDPDYDNANNEGFVVYADYGLLHWLGVEGEARWGGIRSPDDIVENTYLVGPRFTYQRGKTTAYAKLLVGWGDVTNSENPSGQGVDRYNPDPGMGVYAIGAGVDYRFKPHYKLRVELEEQKWGNFYPHTLSPVAITVGVAYSLR